MTAVDSYSSAEVCAENLDRDLNNMVVFNGEEWIGKTCFCCDRTLLSTQQNPSVYGMKRFENHIDLFRLETKEVVMYDGEMMSIPKDVINYYKYEGPGHMQWMESAVMSPRSSYLPKKNGFLVCKKCFDSLKHGHYPVLGIKNGYMIGTAPNVIECLTPEEMTAISMVRNTAHIFSYMGGEDTTIQGWHSMLEVEVSDVHRTIRGMNHHDLCFPDCITIVMTGPMTQAQHAKIKRKATVSKEKMLVALTWLIENNVLYRKHFQSYPNINEIPTPQILDRAKIVESVNSNIELTENMSMVFPDITLDETTGGFKNTDDFKEVISEINKGNTAVTLTSHASRYIYASTDDNFIKAFPKQFPYGIGGPAQKRYNKQGELIEVDFIEYIQHVNNLSNANFHTQMFSILSWNIVKKQ